MGADKALLTLHGVSLLELALRNVRMPGGPAPRIAGSRGDLAAYAEVVSDVHPGWGPLSGIEAALAVTDTDLNVFLPVDLPLIPRQLLAWMLVRATISGALITMPRINGQPQPLCAVYHRDLLAPIAAALRAGDRKVISVLTSATPAAGSRDIFDVERVFSACPDWTRDLPLPICRWFHNCNTPADMLAVEML